ncbi:DNA-directed RNA polymerase subunit beta [Bacillus massilinigeriensis]|uniref:DNA-directed RNA polymerase subunit beta n=1 Tax=Bacillus mediterraneensis TaxID=1805474 RepID=UPI0008F8307D|nr:DNA-directed RNA polymerase subunit beta [Bacillus mediterraneensis]
MGLNEIYREGAAKKAVVEDSKKAEQTEGRPSLRVRLIPIWLRIVIVLFLFFVSTSIGLVVGYSVLGDGKAGDTFDSETWTHITDLIHKE